MPGQPTPSQAHFDRLLTNYSLMYLQDERRFVADKVFPILPVQNASDQFRTFGKGAFMRSGMGPRPLGGKPNVIGFATGFDAYAAIEQAERAMIDDRERKNVSGDPTYDPERVKTRLLTQHMMIQRDIDWATKYFTDSVWTTEYTGVAGAPAATQIRQWDQAASTPVDDIDQLKEAQLETTGYEPNVIVMGRKVWRTFKNHPDVIDRLKTTDDKMLTLDIAARLLEVDKVLVPGGVKNIAVEGADDNIGFILAKDKMLLAYAAPEVGLEVPTAGLTFAWQGLVPDGGMRQAAIFRGRIDDQYSDWIDIKVAYDMKKVAADLAVFVKSVVA